MTALLPLAELEAAVHAATRAALGSGPLETGPLVRAILDRSARYTSDRDRLAAPADPTGDLAARAAFFTIADAPKLGVPLAELASRGALPAGRPLRVVDLGAGCGAMSLGLVASLDAPLDIVALDHDRGALVIAADAVRALAARRTHAITFATREVDATTAPVPPADLVLLGTLLNELPAPARLTLVQRALAAVGPDGAVIVIEPALRDTSRALHELRDAVLAAGAGHVFAPCTRAGAPCPALADPSDWCHEHRTLALPPRTAELARLTHLRDGGMKFAYLVLRPTPGALAEGPAAWRIVSAPHAQKGKLEMFGCSDAGRVPLRLLKRNRADGNRAFERAERGDVLIVEAATSTPERVDLDRTTTVERRRPGGG